MDKKYVIRRYFNSKNPGAFSGLSGFLKNNKFKDKSEIAKILGHTSAYVYHKPVRRIFKRRPVICPKINYMWSADLIVYLKHSRVNRGFKYILLAVDCLSKFLYCEKLKSKSADSVHEAFLEMFKKAKATPEVLWSDQESSFYSKKVNDMLKQHNVRLYSSASYLHASLSERYVRRLKSVLARAFTKQQNYKWVDILDDVVYSINHSFNRSILTSSASVNKQNESEVWTNLYKKYISQKPIKVKLKVGDIVKISKRRLLFSKAYDKSWSPESFIIKSIEDRHLVPYFTLTDLNGEDIAGSYYIHDLQKVTSQEMEDDE